MTGALNDEAEVLAAVEANLLPVTGDHDTNDDPSIAAARRVRAVAARVGGMTYQQIADLMGYTDKTSARHAVYRALEHVEVEQVTQLREIENQRLDRVQVSIWPLLIERETPAVDRLHAANTYIRLSARRSRLNGLDAPIQVAISAGVQADLQDALADLRDVVLSDSSDTHVITTLEAPDDGGPARHDRTPRSTRRIRHHRRRSRRGRRPHRR